MTIAPPSNYTSPDSKKSERFRARFPFSPEKTYFAGAAAGASVVAAALSFLAFLAFFTLGAFSFLAFLAFFGASVVESDLVSVLVVACANEAPAKITVARNNITIFFMISIPLFFNRLNWPVGRYNYSGSERSNPAGAAKLRSFQ